MADLNVLTLKKSNCKNCHKCIRSCPVKSIRFTGNQAHIIENECILCGHCFVVCPQNAKEINDGTSTAKVLIQSGAPVIASLAPSFMANYPDVGIEGMKEALKALGFADAEETALGASQVKKEYERMLEKGDRDIIISSCCHSVNLLIEKYYPGLLCYLADVLSPMQAHCRDIKKRNPGAKTVFIGPCVSKLDEAKKYPGIVDAAMTFESLTLWLKEEGIELQKKNKARKDSRARFFPTTGGILKTMAPAISDYTYVAIDGINNCIETLKNLENGDIDHCFIEMSACAGSCICGPIMEKYNPAPISDYVTIARNAGKEDFDISQPDATEMRKDFETLPLTARTPSDEKINEILRQMGKYKPEHELNCGTCGYNTCRDKAIAVYQGKAEITMCLPYLMNKAESFSNTIVKNLPNGLIVLNEMLEVQDINTAALKLMNLRSASDIRGDQVIRIMDPTPFMEVVNSGRGLFNKRTYLADYQKYVELTIIPDKENHILICILRDVTDEENERQRKESISDQTLQVADDVIEKQMRIAQEIASLLGETTAETKIALKKLKEYIQNE